MFFRFFCSLLSGGSGEKETQGPHYGVPIGQPEGRKWVYL